MFGTLKGRILIILAVLAISGWYLYSRGIDLGLDLQGGMHLVLEVSDPEGTMTPEGRADATDRALKIIRTRVDEFGVEEPRIQKIGQDRIIVELAGIRDEERAKDVIQRAAFLEFKLVDESAAFAQALPEIDRAVVQALGEEAIIDVEGGPDTREAVQQLLFGTSDSAAAAADTAAAASDTAAAAEAAQDSILQARPFTAALLETGQVGEFLVASEDVERLQRYLALPEVRAALPRDLELAWSTEPEGVGAELYRRLYVVGAEAVMSGQELENAIAGRQTTQFNETVVNFELSRRGGREFAEVTGRNVNRRLAILLDNQVVSAPVIQSQIASSGVITLGAAPIEEARDLALVLRAGALPAPLEILEERTIGPSLGAESVAEGKVAGMVGLALVVLITLAYYHLAGVLAIGGLVVYVVLVLGGLAGFGANLTAPGIAGLILSVGMAIDANVLIFERIREELAAGRTARGAVDAGFQNAMSAIVDSNLTTLITALILYQFGTGPVRGFAITLSIGIMASFFSAVFVTKTFFLLYLERRSSTRALSI
ncbi:MAG: protein translocase subunit SecD [Longimicrobiales bacterium]